MARSSVLEKLGLGLLGVYISSRLFHRIAKFGLVGVALGVLVFHKQLVLLVAGSDHLTAPLLGAIYGAPPAPPATSREVVQLSLVGREPLRVLKEPVLGFAIDTSQVVGGHWWSPDGRVEVGRGDARTSEFDFSRPRLRLLARALAPARLRVGGTEADHVYYALDGSGAAPPAGYELAFEERHWRALADFVNDVDYSLLFTVNAGPGPRDGEGAWQPNNARRLFELARRAEARQVVWELGNEVNAYWFIHGLSDRVSGAQYARDFHRFHLLVHDYFPEARVAGPAGFLWPVMGEPFGESLGIFEGFLKEAGAEPDVVTWHYYPQQSRRCPMATRRASPTTLLNPRFLDETDRWARHIGSMVARYAPQAEVWLGESGNAQCGGEPGVSDRFASSLWYLDQIGAMAALGQPMIRQTLVGSDYGMLDSTTLEPMPDYWAAWMLRRLVGQRMLVIERKGSNPYVRTYAACAARASGRSPGSVVVWMINLDAREPARVELAMPGDQEWYRATAPTLSSRDVWLNGRRMKLEGEDLPPFPAGSPRKSWQGVQLLAPHSYAFALVDAHAKACL